MAYYDWDDYFFGPDIDALVEEAFGDVTDIDYGSAAGHPPAQATERSAWNHQVRWWNEIMRRMLQWGVSRDTIRNEQSQVIRGPRGARGRETVRNNQPDIQAVDPRTGRRINVEVDRSPRKIARLLRRIVTNDPNTRAAGVVFDPLTGRLIEKHVYDPNTRVTRIVRGQPLIRSDILDFDYAFL
jgi:hypothetical protein